MTDSPHVTYAVDSQSKHTEPDGSGGFHDVMHVHYTTASGTKSHVKVPMHYYTERNVHDAIQQEADVIENVNSLQPGTPVPPPPRA